MSCPCPDGSRGNRGNPMMDVNDGVKDNCFCPYFDPSSSKPTGNGINSHEDFLNHLHNKPVGRVGGKVGASPVNVDEEGGGVNAGFWAFFGVSVLTVFGLGYFCYRKSKPRYEKVDEELQHGIN